MIVKRLFELLESERVDGNELAELDFIEVSAAPGCEDRPRSRCERLCAPRPLRAAPALLEAL